MKMSMSDFPLRAVFFATEPTRVTFASMPLLLQAFWRKFIISDETSSMWRFSSDVGLQDVLWNEIKNEEYEEDYFSYDIDDDYGYNDDQY